VTLLAKDERRLEIIGEGLREAARRWPDKPRLSAAG
jgi:hypothetical protein